MPGAGRIRQYSRTVVVAARASSPSAPASISISMGHGRFLCARANRRPRSSRGISRGEVAAANQALWRRHVVDQTLVHPALLGAGDGGRARRFPPLSLARFQTLFPLTYNCTEGSSTSTTEALDNLYAMLCQGQRHPAVCWLCLRKPLTSHGLVV